MIFVEITFLIAFTLLSCNSIRQKQMEQIQVQQSNDGELLNFKEAELLNSLLEKSRDTFNFHGKKIAFITGSSGSHVLSKVDYFNTCVNPWLNDGEIPQISMIILNQEEKVKSGGYDVFVLSWVKVFTIRQKNRIVERLAKK